MRIGKADWIISIHALQKIYSNCPHNWESFTAIKCINGDGRDIVTNLIFQIRF